MRVEALNIIKSITHTDQTYDLIVIDGRASPACLHVAQAYLSQGGMIAFDNSRRKRYDKAVRQSVLVATALPGMTPFLITFAAIIFLAWALYQQWGQVSNWQPTATQIGLLIPLTLAYAAALMLLAFNWSTIVQTLIAQPLLIGFLTPGAPGGIAVREAVLIALLTFPGDEGVIIAAMLMRLVTTAGDLSLYLFGNAVLAKHASVDGTSK